jgi:hypothetical protein
MIVHQQRINALQHALGCLRLCGSKDGGAARGQQSLSRAIDENAGDSSSGSRNAHDAADADALAREARNDACAMLVIAERTGKSGAPAKPRDRDRRIGGAAAAGDQEFQHRGFAAGRGETLDPKDEVEHRNARAQHDRLT